LRFLFASRPELMGKVLGMVYRFIAAHLIKKAGFTQKSAQTGAVTLIQRFGSALNLNVHFHMSFLDGVYTENKQGKIHFQRARGPEQQEVALLVHIHAEEVRTPKQRHRTMTWAQRLKRVFNIDVSVYPKCGGESKVIACIKDQPVVDKIPSLSP
jgi:hypothetical protein